MKGTIKPLKEQILASHPAKSVWLTANAGTGKTFVLVNRLLRLVIEGNKPGRILCITYTKAAAAEMRSRVIEVIAELILLDDSALKTALDDRYAEDFAQDKIIAARKRMAAILDMPEKLKIETIHAFCQSTLKSFSLEAGVPPFFTVIEDSMRQLLLDNAWERMVANDSASPALAYLLSVFQLKTVKEVFSELSKERGKVLAAVADKGGVEGYVSFLREYLGIESDDIIEVEKAFHNKVAEFTKSLDSVFKDGAGDRFIAPFLQSYLQAENIDDLEKIFFTDGTLRTYYSGKKLREYAPLLAAQAVEFGKELGALLLKRKDIELFKITSAMVGLFAEFYEIFAFLKKQRYALDYDDLIEKTTELFHRENAHSQWILYKLEGGIDHILLDEAQDTGPSLWKIIQAITSEYFSGDGMKGSNRRSLFVVGDEKQSIYSFQGADIAVFNGQKDFYSRVPEVYPEAEFLNLGLDTSFRSSKAVLDIVDAVLADERVRSAVSRSSGVIKHELARKKFGYFEISELVGEIKSANKTTKISWHLPREYIISEEQKNDEILAEAVAAKVEAILNRGFAVGELGRAPQPGDIMILLRKRKELFNGIIDKLQRRGIPVSGVDRLDLKDSLAVKDLLALGKFALLENDDLNFAALLKSPIFEFTEEHLFEVCWNRGERSVYERLKELAKKMAAEKTTTTPNTVIPSATEGSRLWNGRSLGCARDNEKGAEKSFGRAVEVIEKIKKLPRSVFEFYFNVIEVMGYRENFIAYSGVQVSEILDEFLSVVKNFEVNDGGNLQQFIMWFEKSGVEIKRNLSGAKGQVRIMTVHGAKGLEAPIVILPDRVGERNNGLKFGFTGDGVFLSPVLAEYKNEMFRNIDAAHKAAGDEEYFRLLYVAMTRARDELYVMGAKSRSNKADSWHNIVMQAAGGLCGKVDDRFVYSSAEYLNGAVGDVAAPEKPGRIFEFGEYKEKKIEVITPSALYKADGETRVQVHNADFSRGLAVHRLLEVLPGVDAAARAKVADAVLRYYKEVENGHVLLDEVVKVLDNPEFSFIFSPRSKAEVPVCGFYEGKFVSGKIDRLVEHDGGILIVDYKTNNISADRVPGVMDRYRPQLEAYVHLMEKIYPGKKIRAALLFTAVNGLYYL